MPCGGIESSESIASFRIIGAYYLQVKRYSSKQEPPMSFHLLSRAASQLCASTPGISQFPNLPISSPNACHLRANVDPACSCSIDSEEKWTERQGHISSSPPLLPTSSITLRTSLSSNIGPMPSHRAIFLSLSQTSPISTAPER